MARSKRIPTIEEAIRKRRADIIIAASYRSLLFRLLGLSVVLYIMFSQVFLITQVSGNGMFPSIEDGDLILAYRLHTDYAKNDVVVYEHDGVITTARILGRQGDVVMMDDTGSLHVNGTAQGGDIMYPTYAKEGIDYPFVVPDNSFFLLGDYRTQCVDSRDYGPVSIKKVEGKVITILRRRGI